jgi:hypothetical protein
LLVEISRIVAAATARGQNREGLPLPRSALVIAVSLSLRTSGVAVMSLPRSLRTKAAELIGDVDGYNSIIETANPGLGEDTRLTEGLLGMLRKMISDGSEIREGLKGVLKEQP